MTSTMNSTTQKTSSHSGHPPPTLLDTKRIQLQPPRISIGIGGFLVPYQRKLRIHPVQLLFPLPKLGVQLIWEDYLPPLQDMGDHLPIQATVR